MTKADYETAIDALKRAVEAYPDYAPARSLLDFAWRLPRIWDGSIATRDLLPAANTRRGRSRSTIAIPGGTSRSAIGR